VRDGGPGAPAAEGAVSVASTPQVNSTFFNENTLRADRHQYGKILVLIRLSLFFVINYFLFLIYQFCVGNLYEKERNYDELYIY